MDVKPKEVVTDGRVEMRRSRGALPRLRGRGERSETFTRTLPFV
jgi:hypothetical protein